MAVRGSWAILPIQIDQVLELVSRATFIVGVLLTFR